MKKKLKILFQVIFFEGIIFILGTFVMLFLGIKDKSVLLPAGIGLLCLVPKSYFSVKCEEQKIYKFDYSGRKMSAIFLSIGILLIGLSIF
jgi:hypothetical protein